MVPKVLPARATHDGNRAWATVPTVTEGDLLRRHADVLFDMGAHGRLIRLNEPGDEPPPRLFIARRRRTRRMCFEPMSLPRQRRPAG